MRDYLIRIVRNAYPCSCDEAYKVRGLTSPDCFHCVPLAEAAAQLEDALAGETAFLLEYVNAEGNCIGFYAPNTPAGTINPEAALRLSRREDAEALRLSLLDGHLMRSVEHAFSRGEVVTHDPETCTRAHLQDRMAKLREALIAYDKLSLVIESAVRERRDRDSREEGNYELLLRVIAKARADLRGGGE